MSLVTRRIHWPRAAVRAKRLGWRDLNGPRRLILNTTERLGSLGRVTRALNRAARAAA